MSVSSSRFVVTNAHPARFSVKHICLVLFFSVVPAVLVYLCMGASTSQNMTQPYIVKATAKHTASVSESLTHSLCDVCQCQGLTTALAASTATGATEC